MSKSPQMNKRGYFGTDGEITMAKNLLENKAEMIVNYATTAQTIERYVKLSREQVAQQHWGSFNRIEI